MRQPREKRKKKEVKERSARYDRYICRYIEQGEIYTYIHKEEIEVRPERGIIEKARKNNINNDHYFNLLLSYEHPPSIVYTILVN